MVLYHVNLGWPLLDEGVVVDIPHTTVRPRDADAEEGFGSPVRDRRAPSADSASRSTSTKPRAERQRDTFTNKQRGLRFTLRFSETLPAVFEWKMTATEHYVLGIEPANTPEIGGRAAARAAGPAAEPRTRGVRHLPA